jgi:hypothetical protein
MHPRSEPNLPTSVDWFLTKTTLAFHDDGCPQDNKNYGIATLDLLENAKLASACNQHVYAASGTRSAKRTATFVLSDVDDQYKAGSSDPSQWVTYFHAYRNSGGGWTIQYWSFYAFNTGVKVGPFELGYHGGDWEMVAVVLGPDDAPVGLRMTGHTDLQSVPWPGVSKNGTHPIIFTERGGHEVHAADPGTSPYIVHPTWPGSLVAMAGGIPHPVGPIVDLGTKLHPKVGFLRYSGIWGSIGATPISSGYWGPVFNETGMKSDGFLAAWCDGVADPQLADEGKRECFADDVE